MAVIRDVMPAFELFQPATINGALALLDQYGSDAWVMAGGLDSFDWLKDRIKKPVWLSTLAKLTSCAAFASGTAALKSAPQRRSPRWSVIRSCGRNIAFYPRARKPPPRRRFATRGRSEATFRRTRAVGTIATVGNATVRAGTSALPIRRPRSTASTRFSTRTAAWRSIRRTRRPP